MASQWNDAADSKVRLQLYRDLVLMFDFPAHTMMTMEIGKCSPVNL